MNQVGSNLILYDWLSFSLSYDCLRILLESASIDDISVSGLQEFLGLSSVAWNDGLNSKYFYTCRMAFGGISIHYSLDSDPRIYKGFHFGVCVEMSGQGCREFETYGSGDIEALFKAVLYAGGHVSRLDVAYDDFEGVLDIDKMSEKTRDFCFTSRLKSCRWIGDCPDSDPDHVGLSVCHGSRSSRIYIRAYDKRVERNAYEDFSHWVRLELQLRDDDAIGFIETDMPIGEKFRGVLSHYLNYRDPVATDSNKRRWPVSDWWQNLLDNVAAISIYSKKDTEYNLDRLYKYALNHNQSSALTCMAIMGVDKYVQAITSRQAPLPDKYKRLLEAELNSQSILDRLATLKRGGN